MYKYTKNILNKQILLIFLPINIIFKVMDIKKILRKHLLNEQRIRYGCVMVYLDVDQDWWDELQNKIDDDDIYDNKENEFGRENEPHVTILYGPHGDIPDEDIEKVIKKLKPPKITLQKISAFENEFDVLKFDVESDDLHEMNEKFKKFPYTSDYPDYHPHATIAHLKKGTGKKYFDILDEKIEIEPEKIVYSKADRTKKEYPLP